MLSKDNELPSFSLHTIKNVPSLTSSPYSHVQLNIRRSPSPFQLKKHYRKFTQIHPPKLNHQREVSSCYLSPINSQSFINLNSSKNLKKSNESEMKKTIFKTDLMLNIEILNQIKKKLKINLKNSSLPNEQGITQKFKSCIDTFDELLQAMPILSILKYLKNSFIEIYNEKSDEKAPQLEKDNKKLLTKLLLYKKENSSISQKLKCLSDENIALTEKIDILNQDIKNLKETKIGPTKTVYDMNLLLEETKKKGEVIRDLNFEIYDLRRKENLQEELIDFIRNQSSIDFSEILMKFEKEKEKNKSKKRPSLVPALNLPNSNLLVSQRLEMMEVPSDSDSVDGSSSSSSYSNNEILCSTKNPIFSDKLITKEGAVLDS